MQQRPGRAEVYNEGRSPAKPFSANGETLLSRLSHGERVSVAPPVPSEVRAHGRIAETDSAGHSAYVSHKCQSEIGPGLFGGRWLP